MECEKKEFLVLDQGKAVNDQFRLDEDYNVPDAKPDIRKIILSKGDIRIEQMNYADKYIRMTGKVYFRVLYLAESSEPEPVILEGTLPFEEMIYTEAKSDAKMFLRDKSCELDVRMIHSRKINLKAIVQVQLVFTESRVENLTIDVPQEEGLYKKYTEREFLRLAAEKKDTFRIKEEIVLNGTKENIGKLLWTNVSCRKLDTRIEEDVLQLQGEIMVFAFYESTEGKTDWMEQTCSYDGAVTVNGAAVGMFHQISSELGEVSLEIRPDEDGEPRIIGVEGTLELRIILYEEEKIQCLEDAYSLKEEYRLKRKAKTLERSLIQNHSKCKVTEHLLLPEIKDDILQICHCDGQIQLDTVQNIPEGIQIEGVLHIFFLYIKADDEAPFEGWQGMIPFSYLMESGKVTDNMSTDISCRVEQLSIGLLGNSEVELKAVLALDGFLKEPITVEDVEEIIVAPQSNEMREKWPGIIGYIVKDGDKLWDLAKRYHTTEEKILEVNEKENSTLKKGEKLLIFKENISIL